MLRRLSPILVVALVLVAAGAHAAPPPFLRIPAGPVLAGDGVLWAQEIGSTLSLELWRPDMGITVVDRRQSTGFVSVGASASRALLAATEETCGTGEPCVGTEMLFSGPRSGALRSILPPRSCKAQYANEPSVDVDGTHAAYTAARCAPAQVVVFDLKRVEARRVFTSTLSACCPSARLAGDYLAWSTASSVVVENWRTRRIVYRIATQGVEGLDVQADGKSVVLLPNGVVAWISRREPRLHVLPVRAAGGTQQVRLAHDRIAVVRATAADASRDLVVADLSGRITSTVASFGPDDRLSTDFAFQSGVSFDGARIAWASDHATERRLECPSPPSLQPCRMHWQGVRTIWLERIGGRPRVVTRLPFDEPHVT